MNTFKPNFNILPEPQKKLWAELGETKNLGFVLYGGTAIALQLGHRTSVDFDFFTDQSLNRTQLLKSLPFISQSTVLQDQVDVFTILQPIKVSFFGNISFGRVADPLNTDDDLVQVASLDDLMAHKLKVILQRSEAKDYQDIAAMIKSNVSLAKGLASASALYGKSFQPSESLKACVYFNDGDLNTLSKEVKQTLVKAVSGVNLLPKVEIISKKLS